MQHNTHDLAMLVARDYVATYCPQSVDDFPRVWEVMQLEESKTGEVLQGRAPGFSLQELAEFANTPLAVAVIAALVPIVYDVLKSLRRRRLPGKGTPNSSEVTALILHHKRVVQYQEQVERKLGPAARSINLRQVFEHSVTRVIEHSKAHGDNL